MYWDDEAIAVDSAVLGCWVRGWHRACCSYSRRADPLGGGLDLDI